jgi:3-deoxy-D-arabino-heptulosonate 7-phosphate (DAHP) synthase
MVEVHPNPPVAMSDAKQQLTIEQFYEVMDALDAIEVRTGIKRESLNGA